MTNLVSVVFCPIQTVMSNSLVSFAFVTTLYNQNRNFLDTIKPFVLKALHSLSEQAQASYSTEEIVDAIDREFNLTVPINTTTSILKSLSAQGLVETERRSRKVWNGKITASGSEHVNKYYEDEKSVSRRQNKLVGKIAEHLLDGGVEKSEREVENLLFKYIQNNISRLAYFNDNQQFECGEEGNANITKFERMLADFLVKIEAKEPSLYDAFQELVKGVIIRDYISGTKELHEKIQFKELTIYLDTGLILGILGLDHDSINRAADQLIELLSSEKGIKLKVFRYTLEEVSRVLKSYKNIENQSISSIAVNTLYYSLESKGYTDLKIDALIASLLDRLDAKGISVVDARLRSEEELRDDEREFFRDVYSYKYSQNSRREGEAQIKEGALLLAALHDTNAILAVRRGRGGIVSTLERSKVLFLTTSYLMDQYCREKHIELSTIPEVILDITFTNILWLRNPEKEIGTHLHKVISAHSKEIMFDRIIWGRFERTLKELQADDEIDFCQYALALSKNQATMEYLRSTPLKDINKGNVLELTRKIEKNLASEKEEARRKDKDIATLKKKLAEQQAEFETYSVQVEEEFERQKNISYSEVSFVKQKLQCIQRDQFVEEKIKRQLVVDRMTVVKSLAGVPLVALVLIIDKLFASKWLETEGWNDSVVWVIYILSAISPLLISRPDFGRLKQAWRSILGRKEYRSELIEKYRSEFQYSNED